MNKAQVAEIAEQWAERLNEEQDLPRSERKSLAEKLNRYLSMESRSEHFRRLSLMCAQKTYFRWHQRFPMVDLRPFYERLLRDRDIDRAIRELAGLHGHLKSMLAQDVRPDAPLAYAAAMAIYSAGRDATVGPTIEAAGDSDEELEEELRDAASYSAIAYAGGASSDPNSNRERRREFWLWYLVEAVPAAYAES